MRGKTHLAGGLALTMLITSPDCISDMAVCLTSAAIGSVISDVDVSTSNSHRELNRVLVICGIAVTAAATEIILVIQKIKGNAALLVRKNTAILVAPR